MLIGIDGNEANIKKRVGSNVYAFELIKALVKLDKKSHYRIYLSKSPQSDFPSSSDKLNYRVIPPKKLWTQWRLPLDLYFTSNRPKVFFTPGHYAPRFCPVPSVISILDLSFLKYPQSFKPRALTQLSRWTKYSAKNAAHILTISKSSKSDIISKYNIDPEKITVAYPGVSDTFRTKISHKRIQKVKRKYKIPGNYILFLGTRQPKKNLPRLVTAFTQLATRSHQQFKGSKLSLVIAGKKWSQFADENYKVKSVKNIIETGYIDDQDEPALIKGAQAFVLPSLYEGFGIPVAEAMTVGTPVIVSNTSSLPEVVGKAGILVDPKSVDSITSGILKVLALNTQKRLKLIEQGKKQARKYTWERCAKKTLKVLYDVSV